MVLCGVIAGCHDAVWCHCEVSCAVWCHTNDPTMTGRKGLEFEESLINLAILRLFERTFLDFVLVWSYLNYFNAEIYFQKF